MAGGTSFADAIPVTDASAITCTITTAGQQVYYSFVPSLSATVSIRATGTVDNIAYLYNSSQTQVAYNDDSGGNLQFWIQYPVTAGQTYYIMARFYNASTIGSFPFSVANIWPPTQLSASGSAVCSSSSIINTELVQLQLQGFVSCTSTCVSTCNAISVTLVNSLAACMCDSLVNGVALLGVITNIQAMSIGIVTVGAIPDLETIIPIFAFGRAPCTSSLLGGGSLKVPVQASANGTATAVSDPTLVNINFASASGNIACSVSSYCNPNSILFLTTSTILMCQILPGQRTNYGLVPQVSGSNTRIIGWGTPQPSMKVCLNSGSSNPFGPGVCYITTPNVPFAINYTVQVTQGTTYYWSIGAVDPLYGGTFEISIEFDYIDKPLDLFTFGNATVIGTATLTGSGLPNIVNTSGACSCTTVATLGTDPPVYVSGATSGTSSATCSPIMLSYSSLIEAAGQATGTSAVVGNGTFVIATLSTTLITSGTATVTGTAVVNDAYITTVSLSGSVTCYSIASGISVLIVPISGSVSCSSDSSGTPYLYTPVITTVEGSGNVVCSSLLSATALIVCNLSSSVTCPSICSSNTTLVFVVPVNVSGLISCRSIVTGTCYTTDYWQDFSNGFILGMQISDKPMYGYIKGDHIKVTDMQYNYNNGDYPYWIVLR